MSAATLLSISLGVAAIAFPAPAQTSCLGYASNSTPPSGYGASWDVFSAGRELMVKTNCPSSGTSLTLTVGKDDHVQFVWSEAYTYENGWQKKILSGSQQDGWIAGFGTVALTAPSNTSSANPFYFVGYACTNRGASGWKCGCANAACTSSMWQLQAYTGPTEGGAGEGRGFTIELYTSDPIPQPLRDRGATMWYHSPSVGVPKKGDGWPVDYDAFAQWFGRIRPTLDRYNSNIVGLDVENPNWTLFMSDSKVDHEEINRRRLEYLEETRRIVGSNYKVIYYNYPRKPRFSVWKSSRTTFLSHLDESDAVVRAQGRVAMENYLLGPSELNASFDEQIAWMQEVIRESKRKWPRIPVTPIMWHSYHRPSDGLVPIDKFRVYMQKMQEAGADGFVWWSNKGSRNDFRIERSPQHYEALLDFLDQAQ